MTQNAATVELAGIELTRAQIGILLTGLESIKVYGGAERKKTADDLKESLTLEWQALHLKEVS